MGFWEAAAQAQKRPRFAIPKRRMMILEPYDGCCRVQECSMRKDNVHRKEPFLEHLGDAIRKCRVEHFLSQGELGSRAGFHRTYVTDIENGLRNISLLTGLKLSDALKSRLSTHILAAEQ